MKKKKIGYDDNGDSQKGLRGVDHIAFEEVMEEESSNERSEMLKEEDFKGCFVQVREKMVEDTCMCGPLLFGGFIINGFHCLFQFHSS